MRCAPKLGARGAERLRSAARGGRSAHPCAAVRAALAPPHGGGVSPHARSDWDALRAPPHLPPNRRLSARREGCPRGGVSAARQGGGRAALPPEKSQMAAARGPRWRIGRGPPAAERGPRRFQALKGRGGPFPSASGSRARAALFPRAAARRRYPLARGVGVPRVSPSASSLPSSMRTRQRPI